MLYEFVTIYNVSGRLAGSPKTPKEVRYINKCYAAYAVIIPARSLEGSKCEATQSRSATHQFGKLRLRDRSSWNLRNH